jgi:glycosyltransferase involved in cell wall biosynthesis
MFQEKNKNDIPRCIYLDCTETYSTLLNTGIQRVVHNIVVRANYLTKRFGVPCIPVFALSGGYLPLSAIIFYLKYRGIGRRILEKGDHFYTKLERFFKKEKRIVKQEKATINTSSSLRLVIQAMARLIFDNPTLFAYFYAYFRFLQPKKGELVAMVDAFWDNQEQTMRSAENAYRAGATVIPVIYDLIPLMYPDYCDDGSVRAFSNAFQKIVKISSGMLAISATSQKDIVTFLRRFYPERVVATDFFYLGADFVESQGVSPEGKICPGFEPLLQGPFFLMVGTIEPRKAYDVVLAAFENLWEKGDFFRLGIVGRAGWKCGHILRKMAASPYRGRLLFLGHDVRDEELGFLYQRAQGVIFASYTEGFGLPLVEAMRYGLPVIASDIPIFREIAGSYPRYFRVGDPEDLARVIRNFAGSSATAPKPRQWLTWDESATVFMERLLRLYHLAQD